MKIFLLPSLLLLFASTSFGATTYNCSNPNSTIYYQNTNGYPPPAPQTGTYQCGYETSTPTGSYACSYYYNNKAAANAAGYTITGCQHSPPNGAPVNSALIFLIISGLGICSLAIHKQTRISLVN